MEKTESLEDFYRQKMKTVPDDIRTDGSHFNVFRLEDCYGPRQVRANYKRRDFYKIALMRGRHRYHYADKSLETSGVTLLFFNPNVPYTYEQLSDDATGYFCIFKEAFITERLRSGVSDLPMFMPGNKPSYVLNDTQNADASRIFEKMLEEISSDYEYKFDLVRNYTMELIHLALRMQPEEALYQHMDANARITAVFMELLESQFPIESPSQRFALRSAGDFAERLSVHVNHLNRAIRLTTGKTTTAHIFERIAGEAKALLKHTDWNIAEISYCLGFEEPANFTHFFRKQTSFTPSSFRD
jgi:AraC family transcriptional regulator, transcriptional activator of pobA